MRKPMIVGNWKMNNTIAESIRLVTELKELVSEVEDIDIVVAPSFVALTSVAIAIQDTNIQLGAQNAFWEESGPYTGEVSAVMLKDVGCQYVILGHSERRQYFKETDEIVNKKVLSAIDAGLIPIMCIGETLEEREKNRAFSVVETQLKRGIQDIHSDQAENIVIAYEPVWAIGTGRTATPEQAEEIHFHIRKILSKLYGNSIANNIRILYGGSVKPENISELMAKPNIDGALVGGASLDSQSFAHIVKFEQ